jgi:hypothetical protein
MTIATQETTDAVQTLRKQLATFESKKRMATVDELQALAAQVWELNLKALDEIAVCEDDHVVVAYHHV